MGYGAAEGGVLGVVHDDDFLKGALQGGLGGAVYAYLNRGDDHLNREVNLVKGTEFGIQLRRPVSFAPRPDYRFRDRSRMALQHVLGMRDEFRLKDASVRVDGREVTFRDARPVRVNGTEYVPLKPLADRAGWTLDYEPGSDEFALRLREETATGQTGVRSIIRSGRTYVLDAAPLTIDAELYVPLEFVSRIGGIPVRLDRAPRIADRLEPATVTQRPDLNRMVQGLADFPFGDLKSSVPRWKRVHVSDLFSGSELRLLGKLIEDDSVARGNQSLLTGLLRKVQLITNTQSVVGVSSVEQTIYVD